MAQNRAGLILAILSCFNFQITAQIPQCATGHVERIENFSSKYVAPRNVDIWLPEGYDGHKKYAVLYMHDGQMLFDSSYNWNHQEWGVDETLSTLMASGKIRNCIVVGIWNTGEYRHAEYFPEIPYRMLYTSQIKSLRADNPQFADNPLFIQGPKADNYLRFLVTELKPYIDAHYATHKQRRNTFIAGSSMGGLISWYAMCEYPEVFGGAACLSTHWTGVFSTENNPIPDMFMLYLSKNLPDPRTHRIYFDHGTATLDSLYAPYQLQADALLRAHGYTTRNWITRVYPGEPHTEAAWRKRFGTVAEFLLEK